MQDKAEISLLLPFKKLPTLEMDMAVAEILLKLLVMTDYNADLAYKEMLNDSTAWQWKAIDLRVEQVLKLKVSPQVKLFIAFSANGAGFALPLCIYYYMKLWNRDNKLLTITLKTVCDKIFPSGFPSKEDVFTLWDKTKLGDVPLLDIPQYCESIYEYEK